MEKNFGLQGHHNAPSMTRMVMVLTIQQASPKMGAFVMIISKVLFSKLNLAE